MPVLLAHHAVLVVGQCRRQTAGQSGMQGALWRCGAGGNRCVVGQPCLHHPGCRVRGHAGSRTRRRMVCGQRRLAIVRWRVEGIRMTVSGHGRRGKALADGDTTCAVVSWSHQPGRLPRVSGTHRDWMSFCANRQRTFLPVVSAVDGIRREMPVGDAAGGHGGHQLAAACRKTKKTPAGPGLEAGSSLQRVNTVCEVLLVTTLRDEAQPAGAVRATPDGSCAIQPPGRP